jgi:penicillin amidase
MTERIELAGPDGPVAITYDRLDRPSIEATTWTGAAYGLGAAVARHRRTQMDVLRRRGQGRLAELLGAGELPADIRQRLLGLARVADRCAALLPPDQRRLVDAFVAGVNTVGPGPDGRPWRTADTIAVAQVLFQSLSSDGADVRMATAMGRTLPPAVTDFLLGPYDPDETGLDGSPAQPSPPPIPYESLAELLTMPAGEDAGRLVVSSQRPVGSNAWAVRLADGALLANDMHMDLTHPSLWYVASLSVGGTRVSGVTVPGLPYVVAGTNGRIAWGMTRLPGDTVRLHEVHPGNRPGHYRIGDVEGAYERRTETIAVRGGPDHVVDIDETACGPVVGELAGTRLAFESTLLDPRALDFGLARLYRATDVASAVDVVAAAGAPPLNVILADDRGGTAWAPAGRFPHHRDGLRRPSLLDPPSGLVVSCNNGNDQSRAGGLGWNFFPGDRARRVAASIRDRPAADETTESERQGDLRAESFRFFRDLAVRHLPASGRRVVARLREQILAWRGTSESTEYGLALLVAFRDLLRERVIAAVTRPCQRYDPQFAYCYHNPDGPLRVMLTAMDDGALPPPAPWATVPEFVRGQLFMADALITHRTGSAQPVRWGQVNRLRLIPAGAPDSDPGPDLELGGCRESVCVTQEGFGPSVRLVIRLGRTTAATVSIPGSQSATAGTNARAIADWAAGRRAPLP